MKFIIDAQLPPRISILLNEFGHDAVHTDDLPFGNKTSDFAIATLSVSENRTVITKDTDFIKMKIIKKIPESILLITTGNLRNAQLILLLERNMEKIVQLFSTGHSIIELNNESIILRKSS